MKKKFFLIVYGIMLFINIFSQDSIKSIISDVIVSNKFSIVAGDTQKILLENSGKAYFDGKVTAREIEVKTNVWADFVFDRDYKLLPLSELEKYVNNNSKLPLVPSESDALKGINLANMNVLLLQKIEELTLYVIDQHKEIEALKKELDILKENNK